MRRILSWVRDAARCAWALVYWNARKSLYVLGGRRGRPSCQDPSDFGSSGPVRCDACIGMDRALRFRRVCPLLVAGPDGKGAFCSVPASRVRPFWGRAFAFFGAGAAAVYIVGALAVFTGLRTAGVDSLSLRQVAWPGSWGEIRHERSRYFFKRALTACARRDYRGAYLSMDNALALDPNNYDARLLMAQYADYAGDSLTADQLFDRLTRRFPEARARTAVTRHDTLLSVGRHGQLAILCLRMATDGGADASTWEGSLLLAMHLGRLGPAFVADNQLLFDRLGPDARRLAQAHALLERGDVPAARAAMRFDLTAPVNGNHAIQQIQFFLRAGAPRDAEVAWVVNGGGLDDFDRRLARCWIDRALGYGPLAGLEFAALADRLAERPDNVDKLVATLVAQPDRESFLQLHRRFLEKPELLTVENAGGLWLAALLCDADDERVYWAGVNAGRFGLVYSGIKAVNFRPAAWLQADSVAFLASTGLFGRSTITALYWRVEPSAPKVSSKNKRTPRRE